MTTPDPTPALLSTARLAEIRERWTRLATAIAIDRDLTPDEEVEAEQDISDLLAHLDALTPRAPSVIEARCTETGVVHYVKTGADGTVTVTPRDTCAPSPIFADASKAEKGTMLRAAFEQGRAAERASLTPRAPVDGEALGRAARRARYESRGIGDAMERAAPWEKLAEDDRAVYVATGLALHAIGYAAGRSEGEAAGAAERIRYAGEQVLFAIEQAQRDAGADRFEIARQRAEIARLTAELTEARAAGVARRDGAREERERLASMPAEPNHFRGVVWPRPPMSGPAGPVYRYAVVGVLATRRALDVHPNESCLDGALPGLNVAIESAPRIAPRYRLGSADRVLTGIANAWPPLPGEEDDGGL